MVKKVKTMNKTFIDDTIVGISTSIGRNAVSIIRLSGNESINIVNKIFVGKNLEKVPTHTIHYGHIINHQTNEVIDEVLVSVFRTPKTYTREDVVEINCHGGSLATKLILNEVVLLGARIANEGEFTKRAFLNGRIDLTKAEAVMDIIDAESKGALTVANQGLNGRIRNKIEELRQQLLEIITKIYVNIDYPEYDDLEELTHNELKPIMEKVLNEVNILLNDSTIGKRIKDGIDTVIVGKPNVGKSSLLNALLDDDRAIVTPIPGTTRDIVEAKLNLGTYVLNLIDTAGIRDTNDFVEKIGVKKSIEKLNKADFVLMIFDGNKKLEKEDLELMDDIKDKKHLFIVNKGDLEQLIEIEQIESPVIVSTLDKESIKYLEKKIKEVIFNKEIEIDKTIYITNTRQIELLKTTKDALNKALEDISNYQFVDLIQISINEAYESLSEILGDVKDTEVIDTLFKNFCLGK